MDGRPDDDEEEDESPAAAQRRFETELEFVQSLANPEYLHHLAQNLYFDDPAFRDYLAYLQYWRELPYCLHVVFPHCLRMLDLLVQDDGFVDALKRTDFKDHVFAQQYNHWRYRATVLGDVDASAAREEAAAHAGDAGTAPVQSGTEEDGAHRSST